MSIRDWPKPERPREKLLSLGSRALSDAEILAIFLRTGTRGHTALDLARKLLSDFGGLRPLLDASQNRFCRTHGLGAARYAELRACLEIGRRYLEAGLKRGAPMCSPEDTRRYLIANLRSYPHEVFACMFLDNRHRLICFEEMFRGTIDGASVHVREVVIRALDINATAIIVAHNHPSGIAQPSEADKLLTRRLQDALNLVDVRMLDHFIIGVGGQLLSRSGVCCETAILAWTGGDWYKVRPFEIESGQERCRESVR